MPAPKDPNTAPARRAKKEKARAAATGTLDDVRGVLWRCITRVEKLTEGADNAVVLKASHALVPSCGAYTKVLEVGEVEARLQELEARLAASSSGDGAAGFLPPPPPR